MATDLDYTREVAKRLIQLGFKVVPIRTGKKYPETKGWQKLYITVEEINNYFYDDFTNIGILTGSDCFVIDLDVNPWGELVWKGKSKYPWGDEEWNDLSENDQKEHKEHKYLYDYEQIYGNTNHNENGQANGLNIYQQWLDNYNDGQPLNTPTSKTGSGGMQIIVKLPEGVQLKQSTKIIHPSIDTRTTGGQVVVSPSIHPNGNRYEWIIKPDTPILTCPEWLLEKLQMPNWRDEFRGNQDMDHKYESLWESRLRGSDAEELINSDYHIGSGQGRKRALCSIAGYWSSEGLSGQDLVEKVLPHLSRMEHDPTDPVDEKRVEAICKWVDNKNVALCTISPKSGQNTRLQTSLWLDSYLNSYEEFPLDSLPSVVQKYVVNKSTQLGLPYDFFGGGILSVYAGAIGTVYGIQLNNNWQEPSILWNVILAETGFKKTACFKAIWVIAEEKEREVNEHNRCLEKDYQKYKIINERKMTAYKEGKEDEVPDFLDLPKKRILKVSDATYESIVDILSNSACGTAVFRPEILGWIEGSSQYSKGKDGSRTFYLESYDSGSYTKIRVGTGHTYVYRNHLNIWGYSQTKNFYHILNNEANIDDGFAPRFLISCPAPTPIHSSDIPTDMDSLTELKSIYSDLVDIEPKYHDSKKRDPITEYLRFDQEAQKKWNTWHGEYEALTNQYFIGKNHPFIPWWNKSAGQLARLILIIHIIRWRSGEANSEIIDCESFEMGLQLGKYFLSTAYKMVCESKNDKSNHIPHSKEYYKIARWIHEHKEPMSTRTMIGNRCFGSIIEAQKVLDEWVDYNLGIYVDEKKTLFIPICSME